MNKLAIEINNVLPQTQCTRCDYPSCIDYAIAISNDEVAINQCAPGKDDVIKKISQITNKPIIPYNTKHGVINELKIAYIHEEACIGCTLCIKACPVDAIIGSNKMLHTVLKNECTGCDLCIPVCPVDCISMNTDENQIWSADRKNKAKMRYNNRVNRKNFEKIEREERLKNIKNNSDLIAQILNKKKE